ncbi:MAG: hypothetical protein R3F62_03295 [Planctomycetota bacterium]
MTLRALCSLVTLVASAALAEPMWYDLVDVPLERLIENAEARVAAQPKAVEPLHQLARLHGLAYAQKLGPDATSKALKDRPDVPFFYDSRVPFGRVAAAQDDAQRELAAKHLAQAIEVYARALKLDPQSWPIRLGHAWCLSQDPARAAEAKAALRGIVKDAWAKEGEAEYGEIDEFVTCEAVRYLKPLLDPEADAEELADLADKAQTLSALPRPVTPIALPLEPGLGPEALVDRGAQVAFDLDGSGRRLAWQWITPQAAWLVWDPRARGRVTSATQLFGSRSFTLFQADGYAALALLDDDADGWLRGAELAGLALWRDANRDGVSDPGEVRPLAAWQVTGLRCAAEIHPSGIAWSAGGVEFADGEVRPSYDLVLAPAGR